MLISKSLIGFKQMAGKRRNKISWKVWKNTEVNLLTCLEINQFFSSLCIFEEKITKLGVRLALLAEPYNSFR